MRDIKYNYDDFMDFVGEALEPICNIMADAEIAAMFKANAPIVKLAKPICTAHRDDVTQVVAAYRGITVDELKSGFNAVMMLKSVFEMLNNKDVRELFHSADQMTGATSSVSASENITE